MASAAPVMMEKAQEKLWLMKVPDFLMEHLQGVPDSGIEVGVLTQDADSSAGAGSSNSQGYTLKLAESSRLPADAPRELSVVLGAATAPMHVLSEPKDAGKGAAWRLEGKIERKGEVKQKALTSEYKSMIANRVETANTKREIQTWDEDSAMRQVCPEAEPAASTALTAPSRARRRVS